VAAASIERALGRIVQRVGLFQQRSAPSRALSLGVRQQWKGSAYAGSVCVSRRTALTSRKRAKADTATLAALLAALAPYEGVFALRVPTASAIRISQPDRELTHYTQHSCVCIVVQGAKSATIGEGRMHQSAHERFTR
jgi:hypothetical protein